jgi:hypothetical protein
MMRDQTLVDILDETVEALSRFDSTKLHHLERRIVMFAESQANHGELSVRLLLSKKQALEIMLQNCQINLGVLARLHARNMRNQWAQ